VFAHRPIRHKLILMLLLLMVFMTAGSLAGLWGVTTYRNTVKGISNRAKELPYGDFLLGWVTNLRVNIKEIETTLDLSDKYGSLTLIDGDNIQKNLRKQFESDKWESRIPFNVENIQKNLREQFDSELTNFSNTFANYKSQMEKSNRANSLQMGVHVEEQQTVNEINVLLKKIRHRTAASDWLKDKAKILTIDEDLQNLQTRSTHLSRFFHERLEHLADNVRVEYRTLFYTTFGCMLLAGITIALFFRLFITWIFRPLTTLIDGSRQVATGDFDFRIQLSGNDEMSELADALNNMTEKFQVIQTDLNEKVEQRTIQMVRSDKMASVGFLAAGVAHEINNPMQSIALCAESLEQRLEDRSIESSEDFAAAKKYLQMIQDEAFRCKGITSQLLDLSRKGDETEEHTDLRSLIQVVVDMVVTLTKSQRKQITFEDCKSVMVVANPQEIKQVILNLINNAMESVDAGGHIRLKLGIRECMAEIMVSDNGCGMTKDVLQHLFEPFFTQRRHGQGTGLGLTIAYGIVEHHGGRMEAFSDGPGTGSRFRVLLPLAGKGSETLQTQFHAA